MFSFMLWDIDQGCWMHYIQHYCDVQIRIFRPVSPSIANILVALKFTIRLQVLYQFLRDSPQTHFFKDIIPNPPVVLVIRAQALINLAQYFGFWLLKTKLVKIWVAKVLLQKNYCNCNINNMYIYVPCMQMCKRLRLIFFYNYLNLNILGYFYQSFKEELNDLKRF